MNLAQIIEALTLQVYVRRGELIIHFSNPTDLVSRLAETSSALADLDVARGQMESRTASAAGPRADRSLPVPGAPMARLVGVTQTSQQPAEAHVGGIRYGDSKVRKIRAARDRPSRTDH